MHPTLTPEAYAIERAICDKAQAYWKAHASYGRSGWSSLNAEDAKHPDFAACDNAMRGRVEQFEILTETPERFLAYVGTVPKNARGGDLHMGGAHDLTTWTGDTIGKVLLGQGWRVQSYIGSRMYQARARVNGREYTGRTFGEGACINLRETAASKRRRGA